ncbi:DUF2269 family protein [Pontibacillus yanchengensis]|uniref:DUF2269 family protein n=2 Tax=Pontibacillus yanchengensis TaxID=462910 RepID=A0A6I5A0W5_9BACI|nr:DUF2269 family protein [Pontibacillus yanchengensis]MYL34467.1 DUF2269 family protein [Pontibacillus yanchengensis]MYL54275.1 DUF2269 family protein [Pontibacillus yanchengensis]
MSLLVLIHVLSAIVGVGPTFFAHVLVHPDQTSAQLRESLALGKKLEYFPKIGGTIAVVSGLLLIWLGDYGSFMQVWLVGSLILYILIQIIVIAMVTPKSRRVHYWVNLEENKQATALPLKQEQLLKSVNTWFYVASTLGVLLFILMILKP